MAMNPDAIRWFRERSLSADWQGAASGAETERDTRDGVRGEMVAEAEALLALIAKDGDWALKECETGSTLLVRIADHLTRIRASVAREGTLQ